MTYFTKNIFENILSYCDDRIERKQKKLMNKVIEDLSLLESDLLSTIIKITNDYLDLDYNEYVNHWYSPNQIFNLLFIATYTNDYQFEKDFRFNKELTDKFRNTLIYYKQ